MRLISCYIANFGLHHEKKIDFAPGMNCFNWNNGEGKTTLSAFIKAMLYGFGDNRTKRGENERANYTPWQGGRYGGSITFEVDGKTFTAERTFGKKVSEDTFELRDEKTGAVSNYYTQNLGEEIFGIDCDGFMRTVFWSEKSIPIDERVSASVASRLSDVMGADGDVGNYEAAHKRLDTRRQIYQKRGGGEIKELESNISSLKRELEELELLAVDAEREKAKLDKKQAQIKALSDEKDRISERLAEIEKIKTMRYNRATYLRYFSEMQDEKTALAELDKFFNGRVPTDDEIRDIRAKAQEADRIRRDLSCTGDVNEELEALSQRYSGISQMDIYDAESAIRSLDQYSKDVENINNGNDEYSREMRELFPARVPTMEQIEDSIKKASVKPNKKTPVLLYLGTILGVIGIGAGFINPFLFGICAIGILLLAIGLFSRKGTGSEIDEVMEFLYEIAPGYDGEPLGKLYEKKNHLERYTNLCEMRAKKLAECSEKAATYRTFVDNFFNRVGISYGSTEDKIRTVKEEYSRYSLLLLNEKQGASDRSEKREKESALRKEVGEFCERYPTVSHDPITEIEDKAREHMYRSQRFSVKRETCEKFKAEYNVIDEDIPFDEGEELRLAERTREINEDLSGKRQEESGIAAGYRTMVARLEGEEELRAKLSEKEKRLSDCKRRLYIIEKAKAILETANENMTLRYTGRTQERFSHYVNMITKEDGEYKLDTELHITKIEGGATHVEELYSRGTKELYALAIRLALTDALYEGELPFLVLDDPFIAYDDDRGGRARSLLSAIANERQILYFTCSDAREI